MKKLKFIKRMVSLVMTVVLCLLFFCSCSKKQTLVTYQDDKGKVVCSLDESFMYFWISVQKNLYSTVAQAYENSWNQVIDTQNGTTLEDLLMTEAILSAKNLLTVEYYHDYVYKIGIDDSQKDSVSAQIDKFAESYGSLDELNKQLSQFGADADTLERYYMLMLKQNNLYSYFYGENGRFKISEDLKKQYFENNYAIVDHIFFSTTAVEKEDGTRYSLSEEQVQAKRELAQNVYNQLVYGDADFYELKETYDEDVAATVYYPEGFFVTNDASFPAAFVQKALELKTGEIALVETQNAGIHVMKKLEMNPEHYNLYEDVYGNITSTLESEDFNARISENIAFAKADEKQILEKFNPAVIPEFYLN